MANIKTKRLWDEAWRKLSVFFSPSGSIESPFGNTAVLDEPVTLKVEATGSDNGDGSDTSPFRTIQAAIDSLSGSVIRSTVIINVGAGSFPGFAIEGLQIDSFGRGTVTPTLTIQGTFGTAVITTGLTSSTVTSGSTSVGLTTLMDASQTLTVNELVGQWVLISGTYRVIVENTATTISYLGGSAPTGGTAYTLHSPATIIDQSLGTVGSTGTGARSLTMALPVSNSSTTSVVISTVAFRQETSGTGTTMTSLGGNGIYRFQNCSFVATTALTNYRVLNATGMAGIALSACYVDVRNANASGSIGLLFSTGSINRNSNSIASSFFNCGSAASGISVSGTAAANTSNIQVSGASAGLAVFNSGSVFMSPFNRFVSCTIGIDINGSSTSIPSTASLTTGSTSSHQFTNCGTILKGGYGQMALGSAQGSGNTNGIVLIKGARCQIGSTAVLGAVTELSVDGTTGTLATLRAASPKVFPVVPNAYGTYIYE